MILLDVQNVSKHFGLEAVLDGVSFELRAGEKVSLVGPNGTGKSTLMKIIAGMIEPDGGSVIMPDGRRCAYLEQHPHFSPGQTVWQVAEAGLGHLLELNRSIEETALAISEATTDEDRQRLTARFDRLQQQVEQEDAYTLHHRIERVLQGLGFREEDHAQDVSTLSGGQQNRLLLARLLLSGADLLLLDEPSNHLDIDATEWLEGFLAESTQALLVVSHDRYFLDRVTSRTLELFQGTIDDYVGNFTHYWRQKEERLKVQTRTYEKQKEQIAKQEEFIRRNFYGQKAAQAKDREKKLARIERVAEPRFIEAPPMGFAQEVSRTGDVVLRVEGLSKAYERPLFQSLNFDIQRGERWGILGPNGTGKTTLLRCLVGEERADAGTVKLGTGVRLGYYDQLLRSIPEDCPVVEAVRPPHKEFLEQQRRDLLGKFGLSGDIVFQSVKSLSGGERSRAALAKLAATDANVMILDEPTNHLDLWALDSLERTLTNYPGTLVFVSHDRYFLNQVADHLLVVEPGRFRVIEGSYEDYVHLVKEGLAAEARAATKAPSGGKAGKTADLPTGKAAGKDKSAGKKRKFPYRKVADLEDEIFHREEKIEQIQAALIDPETLRDGDRVKKLQAELTEQQTTLATLYEHWEEATELN